MLARRLTTILPAMSLAEAIETTSMHRVAGLTGARTALVTPRPLRAPHHTISDVGLIGGGHLPMPGEVSLVHLGFLFLDARLACRRHGLEVLRQRLEKSLIGRARAALRSAPSGNMARSVGKTPMWGRVAHSTSSDTAQRRLSAGTARPPDLP
jgi:magnesium chelatase family protein